MQTRASAAKNRAVRVVDVLLHNLGTDTIEPIGKATDYSEAIALAYRSGKVPKGWNVAGTEMNEEHIIVVCKKGKIVAGDGVASAVTAPTPKAKRITILPEKLVGQPKNPDAAFAPRQPVPEVPGILNAEILPATFMPCLPRPLDPEVGFWDIKVEILREQTRDIRVRRDVYGLELLALVFKGIDLAPDDRVKIVVKPLRMENGAVFKIERSSAKAHMELTFHIWDGSTRRCGVVVSPTATRKEIVDQARRKIDDEPLEEEQIYVILHNGTPACQPWTQKKYELRPKAPASGLGVVRSKFGEMTVPLPVFQKARWLAIVRDSMPDPPLSVIETEAMKFQACYPDEEVLYHVRFVVGDEGEEHLIELLPFWENQVFKIRQAFGREMVPDESHPSYDNVLFVKSADGSPPDPTFERIMAYTLGDGSEEFRVRVHKGQTTGEVKQATKALHPGINPSKILFEG
jgi:hypothetical protein